ncbi:MAG: ATP-binding protein [Halofilum sp. (in: g-proteobacteria)]
MAEARSDPLVRYRDALEQYLRQEDEVSLHQGYRLGREALEAHVGVLKLASVHQQAVESVLLQEAGSDPAELRVRVEAAGRFFTEALSPYELFYLAGHEANAALRRLNQIMDQEASRIAHALHDEAGQLLATVYLELAELSRLAPESTRSGISRIKDHLDDVREQLRHISHELRPLILDQLGLLPAIRFLAGGVMERTELTIEVGGSTEGRLSDVAEMTVYRAVQEALMNVTKYAQASRVDVSVWVADETLHCTVADDGIGFDPSDAPGARGHNGLGLIGIRERVRSVHGWLDISSSPGEGTTLRVSLPVDGEAHAHTAG